MAVAEISQFFPPDVDEAIELFEHELGMGLVAEEKLFASGIGGDGVVLAARRDGRLSGVAVTSGPYLRALVVGAEARGVGVGAMLLEAAEESISRAGNTIVRVAAEPGNYLAPGVDSRDERAIGWLTRRGYEAGTINVNLVVDVATNDRVSAAAAQRLAARSLERGYVLSRAGAQDAAPLLALAESFGTAWRLECGRALTSPAGAVHIAKTVDDELAGFAAHDGNNSGLGWFGPAATLEPHRGKGVGEALLVACLVDVAAAGHDSCDIAWIGPREFYRRSVGLLGERTFVSMEKKI